MLDPLHVNIRRLYIAIAGGVKLTIDGAPNSTQAYEATYVPVDGSLVDRTRSIVAGVEVDLDKPLP